MGKRSELMIFEDRAKVCELMARGIRSKAEMARIINEGRDEQFHISAQQIGKDIKVMEEAYMERGLEDLAVAKHVALEELYYLLRRFYDGYETSRISKITLETMRTIDTEEEYEEIINQPEMEQDFLEGIQPFQREGKVKEEFRGEGNPAFLNGARGVLESIHKIKNVSVDRIALTDPSGTEEATFGIADMMKQQIKELAAREAPTDTDEKLLDAAPEDEDE